MMVVICLLLAFGDIASPADGPVLERERGPTEEALAHARSGRFGPALAAVEGALALEGPEAPTGTERRGLENLRARCHFELGDYPACESELRALLETSEPGSPEETELLARLSETLSHEWIHDEAEELLRRALARTDDARLRRVGITNALRARRYAEVGEHSSALLAREPGDAFAHFAHGISLAREGEFEEAESELRWGLRLQGAFRDARFELALVAAKRKRPGEALERLLEILERDPYDEEACYQASQQLIHIRSRSALQTAAHVAKYVEALKERAGPSSRDFHYQAAGRTASASVLRAAKWERLGDYGRAIDEISRSEGVAPGDPEVRMYSAAFWARMGILAEADGVLDDLARRLLPGTESAKARIEEARSRIDAERQKLESGEGDLAVARRVLASVRWSAASPALEELLLAAVRAEDLPLGTTAGRLLLVLRAESRPALELLAATTEDPSLIVPHVHYLSRLAAVAPGDAAVRERLEKARSTLLGR